MTTIILTIIGILLAAAAALMVIFYGGDAFNSGSTGAAANTIQNAGTNVVSAVAMYKVDNQGANPADMNALTASGAYLKEAPAVSSAAAGLGTPTLTPTTAATAPSRVVFSIATVPAAVCLRINTNLGLTPAQRVYAVPNATSTQAAVDGAPKMACSQASATAAGTFYAIG